MDMVSGRSQICSSHNTADVTLLVESFISHKFWSVCSAVMLVGQKNGNISVGEVEKDHKEEVSNHGYHFENPVTVV